MSKKNESEPIAYRAPERLVNWMHGPGFEPELRVSRTDGEELSDDDKARLRELITEYEKLDTESRDDPFVAPMGDEE